MNIPEKVKVAAKSLIDMYGLSFDYLGKNDGADFYAFKFPDEDCTGFPFIYILKDNNVSEVTGFEALDVIDHLSNISA